MYHICIQRGVSNSLGPVITCEADSGWAAIEGIESSYVEVLRVRKLRIKA